MCTVALGTAPPQRVATVLLGGRGHSPILVLGDVTLDGLYLQQEAGAGVVRQLLDVGD